MKPFLLFRGPVKTLSGYGSHSRDLLQALYEMDMFDIKIDSHPWGDTPMNALDTNNPFHNWIEERIVSLVSVIPDVYIQVTVPEEFQKIGKFSVGITAGIETTAAPKSWVDGCNRMDLVITTSNFSKNVLASTVYHEADKITKEVIKKHVVARPMDVLFEGVNTKVYNNEYKGFDLDIKEDFAYLFVGHWLNGVLGEDRKDVGMLIKCFVDAFKGTKDMPALILKTSSTTFSIKERERITEKIKDLVDGVIDPPSIYLLFGELTDDEMNQLYNHPKIKTMITLTKGEGFGRPLLEFSMTGKPIIASNWSGHTDFLPKEKSLLIGGKLTNVHESAVNGMIMKESQWFTADYNEAIFVMKLLRENYDSFLLVGSDLRKENMEKFSYEAMKEQLRKLLIPYSIVVEEHKLILPEDNETSIRDNSLE
jgi:glycosyltransferase involved in cell wall biosynthesis